MRRHLPVPVIGALLLLASCGSNPVLPEAVTSTATVTSTAKMITTQAVTSTVTSVSTETLTEPAETETETETQTETETETETETVASIGDDPTTSPDDLTVLSSSDATSTEVTAPTAALALKQYRGTGDDVVDVGQLSGTAVLTFGCPGCSGNVTLKTDGAEGLLVNTIDSYTGSHFINLEDSSLTTTVTITAEGSWTMQIADAATAPHVTSGSGDKAIIVDGPGAKGAITNKGEGNFVVEVYSTDGGDLAVNEIGSYRGTVPMTLPALVQITSTGTWNIVPS